MLPGIVICANRPYPIKSSGMSYQRPVSSTESSLTQQYVLAGQRTINIVQGRLTDGQWATHGS